MQGTSPTQVPLRSSAWTMELLGYSADRRSAFWQFCHSNNLPYVRTGRRKIQFSEQAVNDWIAHRSIGGARK
jgi:hypothetical protein